MPSKPNSDRGPYDANHNVHHKAHLAFHELLGEPASDSANDDGGDPTDLLFFHCRFLLGRPSLQIILLIRVLFGTSSKTSLRHKRGRHLPRRVQNGKRGAASGQTAAPPSSVISITSSARASSVGGTRPLYGQVAWFCTAQLREPSCLIACCTFSIS